MKPLVQKNHLHSDVCRKMNAPSLGGVEYFLTFIDDKTRYVWVNSLKHKGEVYGHFLEWKALVEKSSGHKLKLSAQIMVANTPQLSLRNIWSLKEYAMNALCQRRQNKTVLLNGWTELLLKLYGQYWSMQSFPKGFRLRDCPQLYT